MSIIGTLLGGGLASPIEAVGKVVDSLFTSDEEKLDKQAVLARLAQNPAKWQTHINSIEASHRSVFVAGWRPFIGWVCGVSLLYNFVLLNLLSWGFSIWAPTMVAPPAIQMEHLITILLGMLGLGGLRSAEKLRGAAK